ncbi:hypothetical protein AUEXF2481DRAFT_81855 [Aureobasidium subglaciale EXF-2481]|uniref:Uncharacterized protein n=1 Tax=Aureobasidium subglaciale (strain EXF-2481) TaxID=1043005 RepID=A0A074Y4V1_AURSE|nr:uncharacterized protein AUEXF2481DRAFT_81855 [Aureobasidium subglaciale EXF-2481]KEQ92818.1 hypothetical protein AUEXF2481DRAFT_81855 [Aureobasidium subglaciale EXF-2481]
MSKYLKDLVVSLTDSTIAFDDTIIAIGIEELNAKGFVNLPDSEFPVIPKFELKAEEHLTGAFIRKARGWEPVVSSIHLILRPRVWKNISTEDYDLVTPALKLASRILDAFK